MPRVTKFIIVLFLLANGFLLWIFLYPLPSALQSMRPIDTVKIYDRNEELLYEVLNKETGRQSFIALNDIPDHLKNAFLSIEDKRFYEHSGVDFGAILRAIWQNVSAGEIVSGGSTITQQVVRNIIGINKKRTFSQKLKETVLALKISKFFDKDEIFEVYLNSIYFGGLAYGVESASWQYFNKSAAHLDLAESAFLAGLPQAPNRYYPFKHFERAKERQKDVLLAMFENKKITQETLDRAVDENLKLHSSSFSKKAPHFVDYVVSNCSAGGISLRDDGPVVGRLWAGCGADGGNNRIVTTLDLGLQERVEIILQSDLTFLAKFNIENAATVILDVRTGEILAMVGSRDYDNSSIQGAVNITTSLRQPGSSIKPLVYATAFEKGWGADTIIIDEPVQFVTADGLPYAPKNFDLKYHGEVTTAEALAQSLNIPAVKTLDFVGVAPFLQMAESFGITTFNQPPEHYGLSLALGSGEVQLLELANAYSVFVNDGKRPPIQFIKSDNPVDDQVVIDPTIAQTISAILSDNDLRMPAFGEESPLNFSFPVAAKTGTTRNFRDNWVVGYTDDYVVGVWVGNARGEVMQGVSGITGAGPIFHRIMNMLHETTGTVLTVGQDMRLPTLSGRRLSDYTEDTFRIISPFSNDLFLFDPNKPAKYQKIKFQASESAEWYVDGQFVGEGEEVLWPLERGQHEVSAVFEGDERIVYINVK